MRPVTYVLNPGPDCCRPDDVIPRCAPCGEMAEAGRPGGMLLRSRADLHRLTSPAFEARVVDAIARLKRGEDRQAVRERHGAVVLRQAEELR